jgi:hypothetical protein
MVDRASMLEIASRTIVPRSGDSHPAGAFTGRSVSARVAAARIRFVGERRDASVTAITSGFCRKVDARSFRTRPGSAFAVTLASTRALWRSKGMESETLDESHWLREACRLG